MIELLTPSQLAHDLFGLAQVDGHLMRQPYTGKPGIRLGIIELVARPTDGPHSIDGLYIKTPVGAAYVSTPEGAALVERFRSVLVSQLEAMRSL